MKQKQNTVVQWSMIALAGIFSVAGLLLFWRYDFAEAQIPVAQASGKLTQNWKTYASYEDYLNTNGRELNQWRDYTLAEFLTIVGERSPQTILGYNQVWWIDNKIEYLHTLTFVVTGENTLTGSIRGADPKITGEGVLLVTGSVAVGSNTGALKSFIWGGIGNTAWTDTTIGGGKNNMVSRVNSTILWGINNTIEGVSTASIVIGGGSGNKIWSVAGDGTSIVGGENNATIAVGIILGMKNNANSWTNNLIVGTNTTIPSTVSNTFVRSDTPTAPFQPTASNAFYLNTQKGVWVNTATPALKFDSRGAVKFGALPSLNSCSSETVGLIGTVESAGTSCVCACTSCGYWTSLVDDPEGKCTAICNPGPPQSSYQYDALSATRSPELDGACKIEVKETCHEQANGFPYCFDIIFTGVVTPTYSCQGTEPTTNATTTKKGSTAPIGGNKTWTYTDSTTPGTCEWTCNAGYHKEGNSCVIDSPLVNGVCGSADGTIRVTAPVNGVGILCADGHTSSEFITTALEWTWKCTPQGGGIPTPCSATKKTTTYIPNCNWIDVVPVNGCNAWQVAVPGKGCCPTGSSSAFECFQCPIDEVAGWACFIAGTDVLLADGSKKHIEEVKIWEQLLWADGSINTVLQYYRPFLETGYLYSINNLNYFVTDSHPFMTTEGWKSISPEATEKEMPGFEVSPLRIGDVLVTPQGKQQVRALRKSPLQTWVQLYNFVVDGTNTYYANGYLVHNKTDKYNCSNPSCCSDCDSMYGSSSEPQVKCYNACVTKCDAGQIYNNVSVWGLLCAIR